MLFNSSLRTQGGAVPRKEKKNKDLPPQHAAAPLLSSHQTGLTVLNVRDLATLCGRDSQITKLAEQYYKAKKTVFKLCIYGRCLALLPTANQRHFT